MPSAKPTAATIAAEIGTSQRPKKPPPQAATEAGTHQRNQARGHRARGGRRAQQGPSGASNQNAG